MSRARRMAIATTSLGFAAASVLTVTTSTADAKAGDGGTGRLVNVFVADNHNVIMSQRLRPGAHKFVIRSGGEAGFQLARPAAGYTKREATRDIQRGVNGGRLPALRRFERNITLLGGMSTAPGDPATMWARLRTGTYWAIDTVGRPLARRILTVRVAGTMLRGGIAQGAVLRAVNSTKWAARPASIPRQGRLTFRNNSTSNHFVILAKLAPGKTMRDFRRWINQAKQGIDAPPPIDFANELGTGVVSPGAAMTTTYSLPRGNYVLTCFWPDASMGGMPHAFMGMYRGVRLR